MPLHWDLDGLARKSRCSNGQSKDGGGNLRDSALHSLIEHSIETARHEIQSGWASVLVQNGKVLDREQGKGIRPALMIFQRRLVGASPSNLLPAKDNSLVFGDRVLGLAAFKLGCLMGAGAMWGDLVSQLALAEAGLKGVPVVYEKRVQSILNRAGDDLCPIERLASGCDKDSDFYSRLLEWLK